MVLLGGLGVVLGKWSGGGPWLGGFGGVSLVGVFLWLLLRGGMSPNSCSHMGIGLVII